MEDLLKEHPELERRAQEWRKNGNGYWEVDHILPLSKGGHVGIENLQILCRKCHAKKTGFDRSNRNTLVVVNQETGEKEVFYRIYSPLDIDLEIYRTSID